MSELFTGMAIIMGLAAIGGIAAKVLKIPVILGYIAAGLLLTGFKVLNNPDMKILVETMGQLGVTLLLFLAGMELPISELKRLGRVAVVTGVGQILLTTAAGAVLAWIMGFQISAAIYLGIALTFGSTIMVVKILSEKGDLQSLYGKIAVGFLLVQDFIAIGMMVVLAGMNRSGWNWLSMVEIIIKGAVLISAALVISGTVMNRILTYLGKSTELLFITSLGWCLIVSAIAASRQVGLTVEMGGFLAGLSMASSLEQTQIIARIRPVRDFFLTWFFVALGSSVTLGQINRLWGAAGVFSVFVLICNPIIVMLLLGWQGFRKRTSFMASLAVAQVSEFSLVMLASAVKSGQLGTDILSLVTLVGIVTMTLGSYMMMHATGLYNRLKSSLSIIERKNIAEPILKYQDFKDHIILFGHNRVGKILRPVLEKLGFPVLVVDFNPQILEELERQGVNVIYGDMADQELYEKLNIKNAKIIISTVPDIHDNLQLLDELEKYHKKPLLILTAADIYDSQKLYKKGADYVLVPHSVGGEFLANIFNNHAKDPEYFIRYGKHQRQTLASTA